MDRIFIIKCTDLDYTFKIKGTTFEQIKPKIITKLFAKFGGIGYTKISVSYSTMNGTMDFSTNLEIRKAVK